MIKNDAIERLTNVLCLRIMSEDDSKNMSMAIKINDLLNRKKVNGNVFVLSSLDTSPEHIDAINLGEDNRHCCAYLINHAQIVSFNLLFDHPLFEAAELAHSNKISVLVIGGGYIGMEFAKSAMWAGQMRRFDFEITIIDVEDKEKVFLSAVGDINEKLKEIGAHINYKYEVADVGSLRFKELIREHHDANYILIALGNDELTVNTSITVRRELIRASVENGTYTGKNDSLIISVVTDENYTSLLTQLGGDFGITIYGTYRQVFRSGNISYSRLDKLATYINWVYSHNQDGSITLQEQEDRYQRTTEISRRSSCGAAVRTLYNLKDAFVCCSFDGEQQENAITLDEADSRLRATDLQALEHKRWSTFMIINGWDVWKLRSDGDYMSIEKFGRDTHKIPVAKLHGCLIQNEMLDELSKVVLSIGEANARQKNDTVVVNASAKALAYAIENVQFLPDQPEEK